MTEPEHNPGDGRPAILIVSSDDPLVELIVAILSPNYQLDHVSDIPEALDKLRSSQYALVLCADFRGCKRGVELFWLVRDGEAGKGCRSLPFLLVAPDPSSPLICVLPVPGVYFQYLPFSRRDLEASIEFVLRHYKISRT